jgi:hypothetical protein
MARAGLRIARFFRVGGPVHAVALAGERSHLLVGSERDLRLLDFDGHVHFRLAARATAEDRGSAWPVDRPFRAVALAPDLGMGLAIERSGQLYRLDFTNGHAAAGAQAGVEEIWAEPNDLYSLGFAPGAGLVALGHLGPALTVLDLCEGRLRWRWHPHDGTQTVGRSWTVAFSPQMDTLYAGCLAGAGRDGASGGYLLAALETRTGHLRAARKTPRPLALVAPLPLGVAAVHTGGGRCEVVAYDADLRRALWRMACEPGEVVTALAVDAAAWLLALGTNTGYLVLLHAATGELLARQDLLYSSTVLSVALAAGSWAAAGLANGQVAALEFVRA